MVPPIGRLFSGSTFNWTLHIVHHQITSLRKFLFPRRKLLLYSSVVHFNLCYSLAPQFSLGQFSSIASSWQHFSIASYLPSSLLLLCVSSLADVLRSPEHFLPPLLSHVGLLCPCGATGALSDWWLVVQFTLCRLPVQTNPRGPVDKSFFC